MDLRDLKREQIFAAIGFEPGRFPNAVSFIDFANLNRWYGGVTTDLRGNSLAADETVEIDLKGLFDFTRMIGKDARFYYGLDTANSGSLAFIKAAEHVFGKHRVFKKPIQQIRHDLTPGDSVTNTRVVHSDHRGSFVYIPKCNFDVEISVDAMRLIDQYDTICLFSGDADFAALLRFLKSKGKKVVLVKGGRITKYLGQIPDLKIEAPAIGPTITYVKRKPGK